MLFSLLSTGGKNHPKGSVDFISVLSIGRVLIWSWRPESIEDNIVGLIRSHESLDILTPVMEVGLIQLLGGAELTRKSLYRASGGKSPGHLTPSRH